MAAKKPRKQPPPASPGRGLRRALAVAFTLAVAAGLVWGVARLGDAARGRLGPRDRYAARFADIACESPPGLDRETFLSEARYVSDFPETFQSLDPDLHAKLAAAFGAHPWVAAFEGVSVEADGTARVKLKFRTPALAVKMTGGGVRVVDTAGVLLPAAADRTGLPELVTVVPPPTIPAGKVWDDAVVKRAAELVEVHHPRTLEKLATGWRLMMSDGKALTVKR